MADRAVLVQTSTIPCRDSRVPKSARPPRELVQVCCRRAPAPACACAPPRRAARSRCAPGRATGAPDPTASSPQSAPWRATRHAPRRWRGPSPKRRVRRSRRAVAFVGVRGGTAPRQPLRGTRGVWPRRVGWLSHVRVAQASPADASETLPRAAPNGGHRAVADKLLGISVASLTGVEDDGRPVTPWRWAARSATPPLSALPHTLRRPPIVDPGRSYGP